MRDTIRDYITDALDVLALLTFAAGLAGGLWPHLGWFALLPAATTVLAGSAFAASRGAAPVSEDGTPVVRTPRRAAGVPATTQLAAARNAIAKLAAAARRRRPRPGPGTDLAAPGGATA